MMAILLVAAVVFGVMAWLVAEPTVKKVSVVLFALSAIIFMVLVLLRVIGAQPPF